MFVCPCRTPSVIEWCPKRRSEHYRAMSTHTRQAHEEVHYYPAEWALPSNASQHCTTALGVGTVC